MCTIITVDTTEIQSIGELKAAGFLVLSGDVDIEDYDNNSCLCVVDVEAVLDRSGMQYEEDVWGYRVLPL